MCRGLSFGSSCLHRNHYSLSHPPASHYGILKILSTKLLSFLYERQPRQSSPHFLLLSRNLVPPAMEQIWPFCENCRPIRPEFLRVAEQACQGPSPHGGTVVSRNHGLWDPRGCVPSQPVVWMMESAGRYSLENCKGPLAQAKEKCRHMKK